MVKATATAPLDRRGFVTRLALGSAGLALTPAAARTDEAGNHGQDDERFWNRVKNQFPITEGTIPLNAANLCPAPRVVLDTYVAAMRDIEGDPSFQNRAEYDTTGREAVRQAVAADLGVTAEEIALVRNTSEGNNIIGGGIVLGRDDEVVLFDQNHPTNNVAWDVRAARYGFTVRRVTVPAAPAGAEEIIELFRRALTERTRVVSITEVSNQTGIRLPAAELCRLARERGAHAHVDGAQTWGALAVDLRATGCDSYAASAHKWLCGPIEAGVLYVRTERIAAIWPGVVGSGWGSGAQTTAAGARKFETLGQRNDATIAALGAAMEYRRNLGPARIEARVLELAAALRAELLALPGAEPVTPGGPGLSAGVQIVRFAGVDYRRLYEQLYARHGVSGASQSSGLRLCPHIYTTRADLQRTVAAVRTTLRELSA